MSSPLTRADFRTKVLALLDDPSLERYTNALVDEALLTALETYSYYNPLINSYLTESDGTYRQYLDTAFVSSAIRNLEWWQYSSGSATPVIKQVPFYAYIQDEQWVFETKDILIPEGEVLNIVYETYHTIEDLGSTGVVTSTTPAKDDQLIAIGAAGHASRIRANSQIESNNLNDSEAYFLLSTSNSWLSEFHARISGGSDYDRYLVQKKQFNQNQRNRQNKPFEFSSWNDPTIDTNY